MKMEQYRNLEESCIKAGPWGTSHLFGKPWSYLAQGGIKQIVIHHGEAIDSILFRSDDLNGEVTCSSKFGGKGGKPDKIDIDWPREFLTSISGSYGVYQEDGHNVITSLCFYTNLTKYGPYGSQKGESFSFPVENAVIVGFHGHSGQFIDSIGLYVKPLSSFRSSTHVESSENKEIMKMVKVVGKHGPGPWGGSGGNTWDVGVCSLIKQIQINVGGGMVHAIQFQYKKIRTGDFAWSQRYGGPGADGADNISKVTMENDNEYLVRISGYYGKIDGENGGQEVVKSITFYTNIRTYGPYGDEVGTFFFSTLSPGKMVGFHGRSGTYLDAIGIHFEYF